MESYRFPLFRKVYLRATLTADVLIGLAILGGGGKKIARTSGEATGMKLGGREREREEGKSSFSFPSSLSFPCCFLLRFCCCCCCLQMKKPGSLLFQLRKKEGLRGQRDCPFGRDFLNLCSASEGGEKAGGRERKRKRKREKGGKADVFFATRGFSFSLPLCLSLAPSLLSTTALISLVLCQFLCF